MRKLNAKKAGDLSARVFLVEFIRRELEQKRPFTTDAVLVDFGQRSVDVLLTSLGIEKRLQFADFKAFAVTIERSAAADREAGATGADSKNATDNHVASKYLRVVSREGGPVHVSRIFDPIRVQLTPKLTPPIDVIVTVCSPPVHDHDQRGQTTNATVRV